MSTAVPVREPGRAAALPLDVEALRRDFPILAATVTAGRLVYLDKRDDAKPTPVIEAGRRPLRPLLRKHSPRRSRAFRSGHATVA